MQSDKIDLLIGALAKFRKDSKYVKATKENPFLKNKYADHPTIVKVTQERLDKNGLFVLQVDTNVDGKPAVSTVLYHTPSNQFYGGVFPLAHKEHDMQSLGGAITYARRYGYVTLLGLIVSDDDDGNTASGTQLDAEGKVTNFYDAKNAMTKTMMSHFGDIEKVHEFERFVLKGSEVKTIADVDKVVKIFKQKQAEK
jgi:hypothetical protein